MLNQQHKLISDEFIIQPYRKGIKLVKPDNALPYSISIKSLFQQPVNAFFLSRQDSIICDANEKMAETCGFISSNLARGQSVRKVAAKGTEEAVQNILLHDEQVIRTGNSEIFEEGYLRHDGIELIAISIKAPWYNHTNKICGVFGLSILMNELSTMTLSNVLSIMLKNKLFAHIYNEDHIIKATSGRDIQNHYFSFRETQCAKLIIRGKSTKQIAQILKLSPRTIEHYIVNMKNKMNVKSKSELIDKIIDDFLVSKND